MKKFILGLVVGIGLATAMTSYAEDIKSLVGAKVQSEYVVTVDGNVLTNKAVVIGGTSYAPLRTVGDALGLEVSFDKSKGVELNQKGAASVTEQVYTLKKERVYPIETQIRMLDDQIKTANGRINFYTKAIGIEQQNGGTNIEGLAAWALKLEEYKAVLADLEKRKVALNAAQ